MKKIEISNVGSKRVFLFATTEDYREWATSVKHPPYHPSIFAAIVPIAVPEGTIIAVTDMLVHPYDDTWFVFRSYDTPQQYIGIDITGRPRNLSYMAWAMMHPNFKILD
jgi:hypothetical protein